MGCCSSAQPSKPKEAQPMKRRVVTIVLGGKSHQLESPPQDLRAFKERVYAIDPVLRWRAWHPQARLEQPLDIRSAEAYRDYITNHGARDFVVDIIQEKPYPPVDPFKQYAGAIAMLIDRSDNVVGNAILITKKHVLVSDTFVGKREDLSGFRVYFQLNTDIVVPFRQDGVFIHASQLEVSIGELLLTAPEARPVQDLTPVSIKDVKSVPRNEVMDYLNVSDRQNSSTHPALKHIPNVKITENDPPFYIVDKGPDDALGAPLFYKDAKFAGVLVQPKDKKKRVLIITELLKYLRTKEPGLVGDEYVPEVLHGMGVGIRQGEEPVPPPASLQVYSSVAPPDPYIHEEVVQVNPKGNAGGVQSSFQPPEEEGGEELDFDSGQTKYMAAEPEVAVGFDQPFGEEEHKALPATVYTKSAFAISPRTGGAVILYHSPDDYQINTMRINLDMRDGFTFTSTPEGVLVAGGKDANTQSAFFWTKEGGSKTQNIPTRHCFHTATYCDDYVYVISGEVSPDMSAFNTKTQTWTRLQALPNGENRSRTGSCAWAGNLYVLGGKVAGRPLNDGLVYSVQGKEWKSLGAVLQSPLFNMGVKVINNGNSLLVFGGSGEGESEMPTDSFSVVDLTSSSVQASGRLPEPAVFREFSPSLNDYFLVFSSNYKLFMFEEKKKELVIVSLPPVNA